MLNLFVRG